MNILKYNELSPRKAKEQYERVVRMLERDDFASAEVKKLSGTPYYRARLDHADRLLFTIMKHRGEKHILLLEIIYNHEYEKSRFLNGARIDESKIEDVKHPQAVKDEHLEEMVFRNPKSATFHLLDKVISFDDVQQDIFHLKPPAIIIGSAGSGKTVLTLEKLKQLHGSIVYVTRSPFLADNSRKLYYANGYDNEHQEIDFLSFDEFLGGIRMPEGRELTFREFSRWFERHRPTAKLKDAHALFEEFNGVITGMPVDCEYLSRENYLGLGVKQSIFNGPEREYAYDLFLKHLEFMKESGFYNLNMVSFRHLPHCREVHDFAVIDEIQDLTNIQLALILKALKNPQNFLLCGDSNQIVHPNFFSWSKVKSMFYLRHQQESGEKEIIRILHSNYRNSQAVTAAANKLLLLKNARFGSIDRESNYLVNCNSCRPGKIELLPDQAKSNQELNEKTALSAKFAVLVMRDEQKNDARRFFKTPLVFSVQEAKGLEYENIILYNFISSHAGTFDEIIEGVTPADLEQELTYARTKDKTDKSLEMFKFHINSFYVAVTRAIDALFVVETRHSHSLFRLLGLEAKTAGLKLEKQNSSKSEWQEEARKLELQGKREQADAIRRTILKNEKVPWTILTRDALPELMKNAFDTANFNRKAKQQVFDYAFTHNLQYLKEKLVKHKFPFAARDNDAKSYYRRTYQINYQQQPAKNLWKEVDRYGVDFRNPLNQTPLMIACRTGNAALAAELLDKGADITLTDNTGRMPFHHLWQYAVNAHKDDIGQFAAVYRKLEPDSISVKTGGRLVKLSSRLMEFFHFNFMFAVISEWPHYKSDTRISMMASHVTNFSAPDIAQTVRMLPDFIMPEYRKKQQYISSILSKNEIDREGDYNRELFVRTRSGHYLVNPHLELNCGGSWINFYDLIHFSYYSGFLPNSIWLADYCYIQTLREPDTMRLQYEEIQAYVVACENIALYEKHQDIIPSQKSIFSYSQAVYRQSRAKAVIDKYLESFKPGSM